MPNQMMGQIVGRCIEFRIRELFVIAAERRRVGCARDLFFEELLITAKLRKLSRRSVKG